MSEILDSYGRTGEQFLAEQFEDEYCSECHGDAPDHDAIPFLGNFFARCKVPVT